MTKRWIRHQGESYDLQEATQRAAIGDLRELLRVADISARKIADTLMGMSEMESILDVYDSEDRLEVFAAMLFLCRRKAGDRDFTWADALATSLIDIQLVVEVDEEEEADPKGPDLPTPDGAGEVEPVTSLT